MRESFLGSKRLVKGWLVGVAGCGSAKTSGVCGELGVHVVHMAARDNCVSRVCAVSCGRSGHGLSCRVHRQTYMWPAASVHASTCCARLPSHRYSGFHQPSWAQELQVFTEEHAAHSQLSCVLENSPTAGRSQSTIVKDMVRSFCYICSIAGVHERWYAWYMCCCS